MENDLFGLLKEIAVVGDLVSVIRNRTTKHREYLETAEPERNKWVWKAWFEHSECDTLDSRDRRTIVDFIKEGLKIPARPPEPKHPGVGVLMVASEPYLIIYANFNHFVEMHPPKYGSRIQSTQWHQAPTHRVATDEEVTEFYKSMEEAKSETDT